MRERSVLIRGVLWSVLSLLVLSGWFVVTRLGFQQRLDVWDIIALRFGGGAIFLLPFLLRGRSRLALAEWPRGIILSILWGAPFVILVAFGLRVTSATMTSALTPALMPVFAGAIGWTLLGETASGRQLAGFGSILVGLAALSFGFWAEHSRLDPLGMGCLIGAAALWAFYSQRFKRSGLTSVQAAGLVCLWSAAFYVPIYAFSGISRLGAASSWELLWQAGYQGFMMSVVANFAFNRAISLLGSAAATAVIALIPIAATVLAIPVLGEFPSALTAGAVGAIALGVFWAARAPSGTGGG
jgi:drug/metabolite transporter (DMT)-like permease